MIVMDGEEFLTAQEACALLGVKPATLYAYVSRGLLESYRQGIKRMRLYRRDEIDRLTRLRRSDELEDGAHGVKGKEGDDSAWIPYV
ncbi:MAG: Citrate synthase (si) [Ktedonobacterales bacterium]|jgi:citrate synthase|nr:MAG: Citrate synthase (si) [Ktedonobacterales bacterium]